MTTPSKDNLAQALQGVLRIRPQLDIIMRLCTFVESREEASGLHIYRLTAYTLQIATQLDFTVQAREKLALAAPLHDVGKLLIPGHILLKPGKLDPEEWEIMKLHTVSGSRLLEGSSFKGLGSFFFLLTHYRAPIPRIGGKSHPGFDRESF